MKRRTNDTTEKSHEKDTVFVIPNAPAKKRKVEHENEEDEESKMNISVNFDELEISEEELEKLLEENPEVAPFDATTLKKV